MSPFKPALPLLAAALLTASPALAGGTDATSGATRLTPDSTIVRKRTFLSRLSLGGYGEATYTWNAYSDNVNRYSHAADYRSASGHGRFDLPHVVLMLGFDFGRGWSMGSEIEFEHGGVEAAVEMEQEEAGEFEQEVERGGEVALEQFWIQKTFLPQLNVRAGEIVVPVGAVNAAHLPTEFFTVFRPEGESRIIPCTWHQPGLSLWGRAGRWRYEAQLLPGLNSCFFSKDRWVNGGAASPFEFTPGNTLACAVRADWHAAPGLRVSCSGYYGRSFGNTLQSDGGRYKDVRGNVAIGAVDFEYSGGGLILRGSGLYGHLSDAGRISEFNRNQSKTSPYKRTFVGKGAAAAGIEGGYDLLRFFRLGSQGVRKLYVFGRYEYYDTYMPPAGAPSYEWSDCHRMAVGLNYCPLKQVVVKAEFSERFFRKQFNNEPSVSVGVAYSGRFL